MIRSNPTSVFPFNAGAIRRTRGVARVGLALAAMILVAIASALAAGEPQRKPDLGDTAEGIYKGDVISDARGSSKEGVTMTVTRVGVNRIEVASDYSRIPSVTYKLQRAMNTIQNIGGTDVFLLELSKSPRELHVTTDDAAWAGLKANPTRR
ncbi:MAG: hypothetical protein ABI557_15605 [Aureliella sp.]